MVVTSRSWVTTIKNWSLYLLSFPHGSKITSPISCSYLWTWRFWLAWLACPATSGGISYPSALIDTSIKCLRTSSMALNICCSCWRDNWSILACNLVLVVIIDDRDCFPEKGKAQMWWYILWKQQECIKTWELVWTGEEPVWRGLTGLWINLIKIGLTGQIKFVRGSNFCGLHSYDVHMLASSHQRVLGLGKRLVRL